MAATDSNEVPPQPAEEVTYKDQLDKAAHDARKPPTPEPKESPPTIVEKVSQFVPPAVGKLIGLDKKESEESREKKDEAPEPGPPERPVHDAQIEEFVRDQHRSRPSDAVVDI